MYRNGINAYKQTQMTTADPKNLVFMCFEGAITNLKIARDKIPLHDIEGKTKAIQKTHDIITLLMQSLNFEKGMDIARNLDALYNYILRRLIEANRTNDTFIIEELLVMLNELASGWKAICGPNRIPEQTKTGISSYGETKAYDYENRHKAAF